MKRLADSPEMLDGPLDDPDALAENLRDLRRSNRWLGGIALSRSALIRLAARTAGPGLARLHDWRRDPLRLLDAGTGGADIPRALLAWAQRRGLALEVTAVDARPEVVAAARGLDETGAEIQLEVADVRALPFADDSFDVAHVSLVLHHLEPAEVEVALRELGRVARLGVVVNDLDRSRLGWLGAWLLSRLATRNRLSRFDAPLSVRRAYRPAEVAQMASRVGLLEEARIAGFLGHRYAICFVPSPVTRPVLLSAEARTRGRQVTA